MDDVARSGIIFLRLRQVGVGAAKSGNGKNIYLQL